MTAVRDPLRPTRALSLGIVGLVALGLTSCADPEESGSAPKGDKGAVGDSKVNVVSYNTSTDQKRVRGKKDRALAQEVPADIRERGTLVVGNGGAGGGTPPLVFTADDNSTPIGVELDITHLVADILDLEPKIETTSFENLFLGLDSRTYDVAISNVGVSEERKEKYDFATYRLGLHAFEAPEDSGLKVTDPEDISGKTVGVSSGTLQEAILLDWNAKNAKAGRPEAKIKYYQNTTD